MNEIENDYLRIHAIRNYRRKSIYQKDRRIVLERDKSKCVECGSEIFVNHNYSQISLLNGAFHHIMPMIYGGKNDFTNICLLCNGCHINVHSGKESVLKYILDSRMFLTTGRFRAERGVECGTDNPKRIHPSLSQDT